MIFRILLACTVLLNTIIGLCQSGPTACDIAREEAILEARKSSGLLIAGKGLGCGLLGGPVGIYLVKRKINNLEVPDDIQVMLDTKDEEYRWCYEEMYLYTMKTEKYDKAAAASFLGTAGFVVISWAVITIIRFNLGQIPT